MTRRAKAERGLRYFGAMRANGTGRLQEPVPPLFGPCVERREGDEYACRCGARWPVGESHP